VEDLVRAYEAAIRSPDKVTAQAFNVGGGPGSILSLLDLIKMLEERYKRRIPLRWDDWRPGDQRVYVSDIRKLETVLGWKPEIDATTGVNQLIDWVARNRAAF
jgi:CDP-paratose 2-epimerase